MTNYKKKEKEKNKLKGNLLRGKIKRITATSGQIMFYFKEHGPLLSSEVTGQDVPQPDDDTMAAVKTSIVDGVFPGERSLASG